MKGETFKMDFIPCRCILLNWINECFSFIYVLIFVFHVDNISVNSNERRTLYYVCTQNISDENAK